MSIRCFSFKEIQVATNNFDEERFLGKGAYGKVYKGFVEEGVFEDGTTTVAVKRLYNASAQGVQQFEREVTMLSKLQHCHVVSLLGYCDFSQDNFFRELILIYEYMPGGTVADRLYNRSGDNRLPPLSWEERINICIGAAEGLHYLHTGTDLVRRVIHCDMKSANILLNDNLESKVSDFGLSKLTPPDKSYYVTPSPRGTFGYHDPAFWKTKKLTRKSDVYPFGVVLLEMLCGRAAFDSELPRCQRKLTNWAKPIIEIPHSPIVSENVIWMIIDTSIINEIKWDSLEVYLKLVNDCLQMDPEKRPTMFDVAAQLREALMLQVDLQVDRRGNEIFSNQDHSSDDDGIDSDIQEEEEFLACGGFYNLQESSSTAGSFMVEEVDSNWEMIEKDDTNKEEGKGGGGNRQEVWACGGFYNLQESSSTAGSFMVEEVDSIWEKIDKDDTNKEEGKGGGGNRREVWEILSDGDRGSDDDWHRF